MVEFIKTLPNVWTITLLHGKWDLAIFIGAKNVNEVHAIWDPVMDKYKEKIEDYNFTLYSPIYNFNRAFFMENDMPVVVREYGAGKREETDEMDWRIIQAYAPDVRQSMLQLGKKVGLSPETLRKRIERLEKSKVICGYKIGLDIAKIGYTSYRLDFELLSNKQWNELFEYCKQHPKIYQVQNTVGHMDFETETVVKDLAELLEIIDDVKTRFGDVVANVDYFGYSTYHLLNYIPD